MIDVVLDKEYTGPDIFELAPAIPDITDKVIKVRWTNTKDEVRTLHQFRRHFQLFVPDASIQDRTLATFGKRLKISQGIIERAKLTLNDQKGYDWRRYSEELHEISPKYVLLQLAADAVRKGLKPGLADIVASMFADGISYTDADVLMRLKSSRIRG